MPRGSGGIGGKGSRKGAGKARTGPNRSKTGLDKGLRKRPRSNVTLSPTLRAALKTWGKKTGTSLSMAIEVHCRKAMGVWYPQDEREMSLFPVVISEELRGKHYMLPKEENDAGERGDNPGDWRWLTCEWRSSPNPTVARRARRKGDRGSTMRPARPAGKTVDRRKRGRQAKAKVAKLKQALATGPMTPGKALAKKFGLVSE